MVNFISDVLARVGTVVPAVYDTQKPDNSTAKKYAIINGTEIAKVKTRADFILLIDLWVQADNNYDIYVYQDDLKTVFDYANIETGSASYHSYEVTRYTVPPQSNDDDRTWRHGVIEFKILTYLK